ncbi:uncharacterized protein TNCV_4002841 [Trichonephila clavipes]|nr:uncharacterized protein TNCV_4002841 [Trichonephila clavipes]
MRQRSSNGSSIDRTQENSKDLGKPRVRRVKVVNQIRVMPDGRIRDWKRKGSQSIAGPSHQRDTRQGKPPTEGSKHEKWAIRQGRETRKTTSGTNRAAERRPVRSKQATTVKPCPYYLRSRVKQPEGIPEERRSIPESTLSRRTISGEGASVWKP